MFKFFKVSSARMKKEKYKSIVGWVHEDWVLKKAGIGIYHTMVWTKHPPKSKHEKWVRVKVTMEEL